MTRDLLSDSSSDSGDGGAALPGADLTVNEARKPDPVLDVDNADKDPDAFLSNFMASRAWASLDDRNLVPFESDDDEEDQRADEYEEAYNMRFEDPTKANEKLRSHARDAAARYSVRREETNPRQRRREAEKAKKEAAKQERREEKARLRKLRIEEVEAKVRRIKHAAGLKSKHLQPEDWQRFKAKKAKKPKFDDDIDIKDLVPDFDDEQQRSDAKRDRRIIEALVDDQLKLDLKASATSSAAGFRYRATSPQSFGLTTHDILLADDAQLNQFVGLKKLAAFRDAEKKKRDKKTLGKKGRLRKWREEVFGKHGLDSVKLALDNKQPAVDVDNGREDADDGAGKIVDGARKKKRRRKNKA
ncbi:hypothetical protein DV737_g878, partial [Chaetothyriales sp. CBS 132003]